VVSEPVLVHGRLAPWRRALAASQWHDQGGRSVSDWAVDVALFVFAAGLGGLALGYVWHSHGAVLDAFDVAFGVLACLALWARRSVPAAVLAAIAAASFSPLAAGAGLVAIFTAASRTRGRALVVVALLVAAGSVVFPLVNPAVGELVPVRQTFPGVMFAVIAFGSGLLVRARREQVASLRERARRLEADQQRSLELAREAERRRIAREMHDVLAHRLSLLSLHAGALEFRPDASAAEIAQAAAVIRTSAAAALGDLREVITVLRDDAYVTAGPPQPTLAQLPALIEESRTAGMLVRARLDLHDAELLPAAVGRTVYRVMQEGLTNARKHAPGAPVAVTVTSNGRPGLLIEVISGRAASAGSQGTPPVSGTGAGLIGLAERVTLAGGTLEHGTNAAGEFVLRATLPAPP
jgi:signal transduction histidine kinase